MISVMGSKMYDAFKPIDIATLEKKYPYIAKNKNFDKPNLDDVWGYSILLIIIWFIFGKFFLPAILIQIILFILSAICVKKLFDMLSKKHSNIMYWLYVLFPPNLYVILSPLRDAIALPLFVIAIYLLFAAFKDKQLWKYSLGAVIFAISLWFRPTMFLLPVGLFIIFILFIINKKYGFIRKLIVNITAKDIVGIMFFIIWALFFVVPFGIMCYNYHGVYWYDMSGANLWEGLGEFSNPYQFKLNDGAAFLRAQQIDPNVIMNTPGYDNILKEDALKVIKSDP